MYSTFIRVLSATLVSITAIYLFWPPILWLLVIIFPLAALGIYDMIQQHSIRKNFPLFGRGRWIMEEIRPFVRQYFVESDTNGTPVNRMFWNIVYQHAKGALETVPFGTRVDTYLPVSESGLSAWRFDTRFVHTHRAGGSSENSHLSGQKEARDYQVSSRLTIV